MMTVITTIMMTIIENPTATVIATVSTVIMTITVNPAAPIIATRGQHSNTGGGGGGSSRSVPALWSMAVFVSSICYNFFSRPRCIPLASASPAWACLRGPLC